MKLRKYIAKVWTPKLLLLLVLVAGAVLFDVFHEGSPATAAEQQQSPLSQDLGGSATIVCNPAYDFNLKSQINRLPVRHVVQQQSNYLRELHLQKLYHQALAEVNTHPTPTGLTIRFLLSLKCRYSSADSVDPLA